MSTLSKIFVVLTLLLSIGYCVAAAFLFAYSQDYRAMYEKEVAEHEKDNEEKDEEITGLNSQIITLSKQNGALGDENERLKDKNRTLDSNLVDTKQRLEDVDQAYKTANESLMTLTRTSDDLKNNLKAEQEKSNDLRDRLTEAAEKNEVLTNETLVLKDDWDKDKKKLLATRKELHKNEEKLKEYESILAKLEAMGIPVGTIVVRGGEPVNGLVVAVDLETDLVVISIGSSAHVTKGMKLSVYRADKFIGSLSVISVYPDMSSARILREQTQREIQAGDNVTNRF